MIESARYNEYKGHHQHYINANKMGHQHLLIELRCVRSCKAKNVLNKNPRVLDHVHYANLSG